MFGTSHKPVAFSPPHTNFEGQTTPSSKTKSAYGARQVMTIAALTVSFLLSGAHGAYAQSQAGRPIIQPGDAVVTGFSGSMAGSIDPEGASVRIIALPNSGSAKGQLMPRQARFKLKARQIGQVFAIALDDGALDDGSGAPAPAIYLGATSVFGLHIVGPMGGGNSKSVSATAGSTTIKLKVLSRGNAKAQWMDGQFGPGTEPGAIWRVDGVSGAVSQFSVLPGNSGPGVGNIVFDKPNRQFFASDLDTGLIYRIGRNGQIMDQFDHGLNGRPANGLTPIRDDGKRADITSPRFNSRDPASWGYTQADRLVWGMAVHDGRLFYAVKGGQSIWSIGLNDDGGFGTDAHWELTAADLPGAGPITDMAFGPAGRLYLAQRGQPRGGFDYIQFARPGRSAISRYTLEKPDDPATRSIWKRDSEAYAIGIATPHLQGNGGLALGYGVSDGDDGGAPSDGQYAARSCSAMLWTTGSRLRPSTVTAGASDVHGLQGTATDLVRPANVPPRRSYFIDTDGKFGDAQKAGQLGDVEIWQPCGQTIAAAGEEQVGGYQTGFVPPLSSPPKDVPDKFPPPRSRRKTNLKLTKRTVATTCVAHKGGWKCRYRIGITNTGPRAYSGALRIRDAIAGAPAGTLMGYPAASGWTCWSIGTANFNCHRPVTTLAVGASIVLPVNIWVPKSYRRCRLRNRARILWAPGGSRWNTNTGDDAAAATAFIPAENCPPRDDKRTNLKLEKKAKSGPCAQAQNGFRCRYRVTVTNTGPGVYNGEIHVKDLPPALTNSTFGPGIWTCAASGNAYDCVHPATTLNPGDNVVLNVQLYVPYDVAQIEKCRITNKAKITFAPGGTAQNTNPGDDRDQATAYAPADGCKPKDGDTPTDQQTNLKLEKHVVRRRCTNDGGQYACYYVVKVINAGANAYHGEIRVADTPPFNTQASLDLSPSWSCTNNGRTLHCTHPATTLNPGAFVTLNVKVSLDVKMAIYHNCRITNRAAITSAAAGTVLNTDPGDDEDTATAFVVNGYLCGNRPPLDNTPVSCPPGYRKLANRCVSKPVSCPAGWTSTPIKGKCCRPGTRWNGKRCKRPGHNTPVDHTPPPNDTTTTDRPPTDRPNDTTVPNDPPTNLDPPSDVVTPTRKCPIGTTGVYPDCKRKRRCTSGRVRHGSRCVCPSGKRWTGSKCVRPRCPKGKVGRYPNCKKVQKHGRGAVSKRRKARQSNHRTPRHNRNRRGRR